MQSATRLDRKTHSETRRLHPVLCGHLSQGNLEKQANKQQQTRKKNQDTQKKGRHKTTTATNKAKTRTHRIIGRHKTTTTTTTTTTTNKEKPGHTET